jgi:uncharacterized protein (TIGR03435 family)
VVGPPWIREQRYDVAATLPQGATKADIPAMLQQLLAERFHISIHRELRETEVYAITIGKSGPRLQPCEAKPEDEKVSFDQLLAVGPQKTAPGVCPPSRAVSRRGVSMMVETNTLDDLANRLQSDTDYPVVDRTGLKGNFKIYISGASLLTCTPQDHCLNEDPTGLPTLFSELEKLGLRLEQRREKLEYLVVDGGDKVPTEN